MHGNPQDQGDTRAQLIAASLPPNQLPNLNPGDDDISSSPTRATPRNPNHPELPRHLWLLLKPMNWDKSWKKPTVTGIKHNGYILDPEAPFRVGSLQATLTDQQLDLLNKMQSQVHPDDLQLWRKCR